MTDEELDAPHSQGKEEVVIMPGINEVILAVSGSLAASIVAKATVAAALGLIGVRLARRSRAAVRHALLAAVFGVLLLLPILSMVAPPFRVTVPAAAEGRAAKFGRPAMSAAALTRANFGALPTAPQPARISLSTLLLIAWMGGMALFLAPVGMGLWQVRRLRRAAVPWPHGQAAADRLTLDAGIRRRIEVLLHEALPGPMTCGLIRPAIVLSTDAQMWQMDDLNRAMVHELEHVRRGDVLSHGLARAICALYWFHPLVWVARHKLALEAERCCDDAVLEYSEPTAYADQLVQLARRLSSAAKAPLLAMANRADLATRVDAVLDCRQRRGRLGAMAVALACTAAALCVIAISPLQVIAAQQSAGASVGTAPLAGLSTTTNLVMEQVTVTDANGKSIEGLSADDFAITEDGVPQRIMVFEFQRLDDGAQGNSSISSYYLLGYYTPNGNADGAFRQIKVTSTRDDSVTLKYRPGYYADQSFTRFNGAAAVGSGVVERRAALAPGITPPALISKVDPAYSEEARKAKFQGHVVLSVDIDATGKVTNVLVAKHLGLGLDEKAIEAAKQWSFTPAKKDGKPVAVQVEVEVDFRLL